MKSLTNVSWKYKVLLNAPFAWKICTILLTKLVFLKRSAILFAIVRIGLIARYLFDGWEILRCYIELTAENNDSLPQVHCIFTHFMCIFLQDKNLSWLSIVSVLVAWLAQWIIARLPPLWPGFDSRTRRLMWVEFVVGSRLTPRVFSGFSGFPPSTKTNTNKFKY